MSYTSDGLALGRSVRIDPTGIASTNSYPTDAGLEFQQLPLSRHYIPHRYQRSSWGKGEEGRRGDQATWGVLGLVPTQIKLLQNSISTVRFMNIIHMIESIVTTRLLLNISRI